MSFTGFSKVGSHVEFLIQHDLYDKPQKYTVSIGLDYCSVCTKRNNKLSKKCSRCYIPCDFCSEYDEKCYHSTKCDTHTLDPLPTIKGFFPLVPENDDSKKYYCEKHYPYSDVDKCSCKHDIIDKTFDGIPMLCSECVNSLMINYDERNKCKVPIKKMSECGCNICKLRS